MSVKLVLGRTDTIYENYDVPSAVPDVVELGPFEYVEFTYDLLRTSPDGEVIGSFREGVWFLDDSPYPFSDLDICAWDISITSNT